MSILIVDDFEEQRDLLAAILKQAGYRSLVLVDSAAEALKQLGVGSASQPSHQVDIVLMDQIMPEMDGLEACRKIRSEERLQHLPVIVVTANTDAKELIEAYTAGATDYIRKPVIPAELVARVSMAMSLKEEFDNRAERMHELDEQSKALNKTVQELKSLRGTLCICAKCKRVKTSSGIWQRLEDFLEEKLHAKISSSVCTRCTSEAPGQKRGT